MSNKYPSLQAFVGAFASDNNETGSARRHFDLFVTDEAAGPGVEEPITVITCCPHGFDYLTHRFGLDGNSLTTPEQIEATKQQLVAAATARNEAAQLAVAELQAADGVKLAGGAA